MNNIIDNKHLNKLQAAIIVLIIIILTVIAYILLKNSNVILISNIMLLILILLKSKFSYFSIKTVIINYILIAAFFQFNMGQSYGILEKSPITLHYLEINVLIFCYNVITYLWINYTKILENEKNILENDASMTKLAIYFCCILAITTSIIAFPGMPFAKEYLGNRFGGLLPGNAWNHIAIVCLLFLLPNFKKNNIVKITYAFVIFWFLSHYERVDIIGVLVFCVIYFLARKKHINYKTYIILALVSSITIFTFVYVGEARVDNSKNISIVDIFRKTLVQNTASDLAYVFNASVEYTKNEKLLYGKTYSTYLLELLPFVDSNLRCEKILNEKYFAPGGEFILSEPIMNFGLLGGMIFQILEFGIYTIILSKKSKYRFLVYAFLVMTVFRTTWYGWVYIEKALVYFIPIIYFVTYKLDYWYMKNKIEDKEERVNVLFYTEKWASGGIEAFIMNVLSNLDSKKIKADIMTSQNETDIYDEEITHLGGEKYVTLDKKYNSPIIRTLRNFSKFEKNIKSKHYDVLHLNICHGVAMIYSYIAKKSGVKYVILHSHNSDIGNEQKRIKILGHNIFKHLFEKYADEYFACSELAAEWLFTRKTRDSGKVKIINNAIDSKKFRFNEEDRKKFRRELNIEDKFVIGHIGRFGEQKNHDYLIDIFNEINKVNRNSVLVLVGEGELKQKVIDKVSELGLKDNVIFYGLTKDVPTVLSGIDVFVLPSLFEGKPVVGIETQAASLKTYMSDTITKTVQITDYIEYLSINEAPKKWADRIIETGKDYERKDMTDVIVKNGYDIQAVAKQIENVYLSFGKSE